MYRKDSEKWLKHFDFIALDMICLQLAFMFAYAIRGYGMNVFFEREKNYCGYVDYMVCDGLFPE